MTELTRTIKWLNVQATRDDIDKKALYVVKTAGGQIPSGGGTNWYIAQAIAEECIEEGTAAEVVCIGRPKAKHFKGSNEEDHPLWD
jgi:hypothetical protein